MFWRFGAYATLSSLDNILEKRDATVEELLDESDLLQELKHQNAKLIDFLREERILKKLFEYVIADKPSNERTSRSSPELEGNATKPPEKRISRREKAAAKISFFSRSRSRSHSTHKHGEEDAEADEEKKDVQRKKYAFVSAEILSSDVWSIIEATLEYQDMLRGFWEYLRRPAPLDPLQAGYFTKINDTLLDKKTEEMLNFIKSLDGIIPEMLKHVECPMIMDLLLKMISLERQEGGQGIVDWLENQGLIPILLSYLSPDNPISTQTAAGDFLKAIITISANATGQDQTVIGPNELTRQLVSEKCITKIIEDMLSGGNPLTVGVGIVIEVIRKNNSDYDVDNHLEAEPRASDPIYLGTLLREFARNIPAFMALIRGSSADKPDLKVASGGTIQPLGFDRFKTCELMAELLHCSNMGLLNERGSDQTMRARDIQRQMLKQQGKLTPVPIANQKSEEPFAGSVDSHGFHHAERPNDGGSEHDDGRSRLEVQNASDEDGFEKVAIPETEALPDEVMFDDLNEAHAAPRDVEGNSNVQGADGQSSTIEAAPGERRRVSLLTQQIQDQIDQTQLDEMELVTSPDDLTMDVEDEEMKTDSDHPEDKPAPLTLHSASSEKDGDHMPMDEDSPHNHEPLVQSVTTLHPELTEPSVDTERHPFEVDLDGTPVVGDVLKIQFVDHQVVPTILDFFFRFPWNNFLHNVVYDVIQQVFNGSLERGHNRTLARDLFNESSCEQLLTRADVVQRVLDGQAASEASQRNKGMRLGYMGHLTLIAEEICKFAERYPADMLGEDVYSRVTCPEWMEYVEGTLSETRERDNAVLGGVRPEQGAGARSMSTAGVMSQGNFGGNGNGNSSALADAGLAVPSDSLELHDNGSVAYGGADESSLEQAGHDNEQYEANVEEAEIAAAADDEHVTMEDEHSYTGADAMTDESGTDVNQDSYSEHMANPTALKTTNNSLPAPLNIPPSRARLQLAARLAQRKKEAEEAAALAATTSRSDHPHQSTSPNNDPTLSSSSESPHLHTSHDSDHLTLSPILLQDPDSEDSTALRITSTMNRDEPLTNDTLGTEHPSVIDLAHRDLPDQNSNLDPNASDDDNDSDDSDDDLGNEEDEKFHTPTTETSSSGAIPTSPGLDGSSEAQSMRRGSASGSKEEREERRNRRRPSTTEAKVRQPLDDHDALDEVRLDG